MTPITIITPSYNQGKFIKRTIDSVLHQGVHDVEFLIFDGGSSDETVEILRSCGEAVKWVSGKDNGQADAVNKGLVAAKGEIIGWLNSDDIYYPDAFKKVLDVFRQRPDVDILYGMADHIDETDAVLEPYYNEAWNYERLKDVCFICQPAVFFRKSIIEKFGLLDVNLHYCMDYEFWLRIGRTTPFYYCKEKLAGSRMYRDNKTLRAAVAVHEEVLHMFKDKFGAIPSRWLYNHAHAVARQAGFRQDTPEANWQFVKKIAAVVIRDGLTVRHYVKPTEIVTLAGWLVNARRALR